jgi:predicted dehydrogenase
MAGEAGLNKIRIAGIGAWHDHTEMFLNLVKAEQDCELVAVWDHNVERGKIAASKLGVPFIADFNQLLSDKSIQAFVIAVERARNAQVILASVKAGKGIFVDKPFCLSASDARTIREAVHQGGVHFAMADPTVTDGEIYAKNLVDSGKIGKIVSMRARIGHNAGLDQNGPDYNSSDGGAMADMGCHPLHALHYFLGKPLSAAAMFSDVTPRGKKAGVEENVVAILKFANETTVILETSWVSPSGSKCIEADCTNGCVQVSYEPGDPKPVDAVRYKIGNGPWMAVKRTDLPPVPAQHIAYWIKTIRENIPPDQLGKDPMSHRLVNVDDATDMIEAMEAVIKAAGSGKTCLV